MNDKRTEQYYNNRAPEYEQIYFRDMPERRKEIADEVRFIRELCAGKEVLDIACGSGYWTERISETASSIVACDISAEMLDIAQKKKYHCPVKFVRTNINHLPFAPNSFDVVILGFWFSHHPKQDYQNLFKSITDPLKPNSPVKSGSPVWMIENNPPAEGPENQSHHVDENGNNYKKRFLDNQEEYIILKNYFQKAELIEIFESYFKIERLIYGKYYWSVLLNPNQ